MKLLDSPNANDVSLDEMNELIEPHLDQILKEQKNSEQVRAERAAGTKEDAV